MSALRPGMGKPNETLLTPSMVLAPGISFLIAETAFKVSTALPRSSGSPEASR